MSFVNINEGIRNAERQMREGREEKLANQVGERKQRGIKVGGRLPGSPSRSHTNAHSSIIFIHVIFFVFHTLFPKPGNGHEQN